MFVEDKTTFAVLLVLERMSGRTGRFAIKIFLVALLCLFYSRHGMGQVITIPDGNFRQCLKETYPSIFDTNDQVIIGEAQKIETTIACTNKGINDISGIEVFSNAGALIFNTNNISTIPDLSNLPNLLGLDFTNNHLTSLPDLSLNVSLQYVEVAGNNFSIFPDIASKSNISTLDFQHNNLTTVPDLSGFVNLQTLELSFNPIEELPSLVSFSLGTLGVEKTNLTVLPDLSNQPHLSILRFGGNPQITVWPEIGNSLLLQELSFSGDNISEIPDLSRYAYLKFFSCAQNQLTKLPESLSALTELQSLECFGNKLSSLPDLSNTKIGFMSTSVLDVSANYLTFEDLIPVVTPTAYSALSYGPQALLPEDINVQKNVGETFTINTGIDQAITDNTYTWYRDGVLLTTTHTNTLTIENLKESDAGIYRCEITNPRVLNLTLKWGNSTLSVCGKNVNTGDFSVETTLANCTDKGSIRIESIGNGSLANTTFEVKEISSANVTSSLLPQITGLSQGNYTLTFLSNGCSLEWPETLIITKDPNCDKTQASDNAVFSPNHDGVADDIYIPSQGTAKIYDRSGVLVKELQVPGAWDGTDDSNRPLPMGTYIIKSTGQKDFMITIIK